MPPQLVELSIRDFIVAVGGAAAARNSFGRQWHEKGVTASAVTPKDFSDE
jgi:hypothetical protein